MKNITKAFSLLELTIVIIIISILLSASLKIVGYTRSQEVKTIMTSATSYIATFTTFYDSYTDIPGDMDDATTIISSSITNDGDGDGSVDSYEDSNEFIYVWEHLFYAELTTFNPITQTNDCDTSKQDIVPGYNVPVIIPEKAFLSVTYLESANKFGTFTIGNGTTCESSSTSLSNSGIFTAEEVRNIYKKYYGAVPLPADFAYASTVDNDNDALIQVASAVSGSPCDYDANPPTETERVCYILYRFSLE